MIFSVFYDVKAIVPYCSPFLILWVGGCDREAGMELSRVASNLKLNLHVWKMNLL